MLELASIIVLGIAAQWIAWRTRMPAILPLILIGLIVGPISTLFSADGTKWIEPIYNVANDKGLFPGNSLFYFVSLSIGIILFEGGLTLKRKEIKEVGGDIIRLISIGAIVTFIGATIAIYYVLNLNLSVSALIAALIIVTGPTVIAPILRNTPLNKNVATVLKWEGILIDPVGALSAVLVFEFIHSGLDGQHFTAHAFKEFLKIVFLGLSIGWVNAKILTVLIRKELIPHYLLNVFTLGHVLLVFVMSDLLVHESGLLSVVVMGMVLANMNVPKLKEILDFKESLSLLLISLLFILLSANIEIEQLKLLMNIESLLIFLIIILVLRPLGVFLSTIGSTGLNFNEKLFISWVGPRGIVAAGIASLFGIKLSQAGYEGAEMITPVVFMVVLGTVLLNATTARLMAKWLKVTKEQSNGILIIGANRIGRMIAEYLVNNNRAVVLVDNSESMVSKAKQQGFTAFQANVFTDDLSEHFELLDMGYLIALTSSDVVNEKACKRFKHNFGENGTFRMISSEEMKSPETIQETSIFSYTDDFVNFSEVARDYPGVHEVAIENSTHFKDKFLKVKTSHKRIPIFKKTKAGLLTPIPKNIDLVKIEEGDTLVYLGEKLTNE